MIYDVYGVKNPKYNPRSEYFQNSPYIGFPLMSLIFPDSIVFDKVKYKFFLQSSLLTNSTREGAYELRRKIKTTD